MILRLGSPLSSLALSELSITHNSRQKTHESQRDSIFK